MPGRDHRRRRGGAPAPCIIWPSSGWTDCLLIDRDELSLGFDLARRRQRPKLLDELERHQVPALFQQALCDLGDTVGYPINYHVTGSIRLAHKKARDGGVRPRHDHGRAQGIDFEDDRSQRDQVTLPADRARRHHRRPLGSLRRRHRPLAVDPGLAKGAKDQRAPASSASTRTAIRQKPAANGNSPPRTASSPR